MKAPKGWKILSMGMLGEVQAGRQRNPNITEGKLTPYLRVANVQDGWIDFSDVNQMPFSSRELPVYELREGDILLSEGQSLELVGRPAVYHNELPGCCFQNTLVRLRPVDQNPHFCYYVCYWLYVNGAFQRIAKQTTSIAHLGVSRFAEVNAFIPPLPEQQKIADILGTWDEALEKLDALIAAKARRKQALMQQLLTGHRRLPGFSKPWAQTTFGQFLTESRIEGSDGLTARKITVKLYGRGVLAKQERMVGSSNTRYFVRRAGQLIYSKLDFLNGAFGIIPPELDDFESTLDLPSFDVKPSADARWLLAYLVRPEFYEKQVGAAAGGRIARRVNPPEFLKLRLKAPEIAEQRAIAAVLDTADAELRLLRQQRTAIDHQKRGLMQQLLTGRIRVSP